MMPPLMSNPGWTAGKGRGGHQDGDLWALAWRQGRGLESGTVSSGEQHQTPRVSGLSGWILGVCQQ